MMVVDPILHKPQLLIKKSFKDDSFSKYGLRASAQFGAL
jgi:hypothetical protein